MSTIKSSDEHLTLNADGASKEVKIQRNGTQVLATTSTGIDVTGTVTAVGSINIDHSGSDTFATLVAPLNRDLRIDLQANDDNDGLVVRDLRDNSERFVVNAGGNVGIGTSSPAKELDVSGEIRASSGILFGTDTAAANALDDYEEGIFTPVIADASSGGNTGSASVRKGFYTKIGRLVNLSLYFTNIDTTGLTSSNHLYFRGFPFTSNSATNHYADGVVRVDNVSMGSHNSISAVMTNNDSWCRIFKYGDDVLDDGLQVQAYSSGSADVYINITYMV